MNQKMYYITVSNGLLDGKHQKKMGSAVWQYMWCLDKITKIDDEGFGWVLGGKPIKLEEVKGVSRDTVSRNLNKLEKTGYLNLIHTPYGISIRVAKAQKRFSKNAKPVIKRLDDSVEPNRLGNNVEPLRNNVEPNKIIQLDKTDKTLADEPQVEFSLKEEIAKMMKSERRDIRIIGWFIHKKGVSLKNKAQLGETIRRHIRASKSLVSFDVKQIENAAENADRLIGNKWTLETLYKLLTK